MDSILPSKFDWTKSQSAIPNPVIKVGGRLPVYLRSSVTALYPFGDPLIDNIVLNFSTVLRGKTSEASCASFSRIWCVLRSSVDLLKYSD